MDERYPEAVRRPDRHWPGVVRGGRIGGLTWSNPARDAVSAMCRNRQTAPRAVTGRESRGWPGAFGRWPRRLFAAWRPFLPPNDNSGVGAKYFPLTLGRGR